MTKPPQVADVIVRLRALNDDDRGAIARWSYPGALAIYDPGVGASALRAPDHVALAIPSDPLIGYGTAGVEACVRGGLYPDTPGLVDVGLGLRPDLVGEGLGSVALKAVAAWVVREQGASRLRATVAALNARARALVEHAGFTVSHRFERVGDQRAFVQYERAADVANIGC